MPAAPKPHARRLRAATKIVALAFVLAAASNEWIRMHRTLWIVNGFERELSAILRDGSVVKVEPGAAVAVPIAEGFHALTFGGAYVGALQQRIADGYFARWFSKRTWIVNPNGAATILETTLSPTGADSSFHFGNEFVVFPSVDFVFRTLPPRRANAVVGIEVFSGSRAQLFRHLESTRNRPEAVRFAKATIPAQPNDSALLDAVADVFPPAEFSHLLKPALAARPVAIAAHRHYQNLNRDDSAMLRLRDEYDAALKHEPQSAALLYLRGRIAETRAETVAFFERALASAPGFPWASFALGYDAMARGEFEKARAFLETAHRANPSEGAFRAAWNSLRIGLGRVDECESELRRALGREMRDWRTTRELAVLLAGHGKLDEALKVIAQTERHAHATDRKESANAARTIEREACYFASDLEVLETRVLRDGARNSPLGVLSLLASGRVADAVALPYFTEFLGGDGWRHLVVSLAAESAGNRALADEYRTRAIPLLVGGSPDHRRAAMILQHGETEATKLDDVIVSFQEKAALCAVLAVRFGEHRAKYAALATKLNLLNDPIVTRATQAP